MGEGDLGGFGDARLRRVGARLLGAMREAPTMCLHALASDRNEAIRFGRFLDNAAVSADEMLVHAGRLTGERAAGRHVLAVQDTTELHFAGHAASKRGFGAAGNGHDIGLFVHPTIALDAASGGVIGLVGAQVINRTAGKATARRSRGADDKESRRWLSGAETAASLLAQAERITVVADRESDLYDLFARRPEGVHLLCRAAQDRSLASGPRLFAACAAWPERERYRIEVPGHGARPARTATVALRFGEVTLRRPATADRNLAETLTLRVVDAAEVGAGDAAEVGAGDAAEVGREDLVHWCLLTTHDVPDLARAREIVVWYRARWTIEQVFRTLKSAGAQAEASQVEEARRFVKLAVAALIAAVRIVQIVIGRDAATGQALSDAADPTDTPMLKAFNAKLEGRTDRLRNPHGPHSLAWFAWIVARLGGWAGCTSKGYKPPGPKTIARGLAKLDSMSLRYSHIAKSSRTLFEDCGNEPSRIRKRIRTRRPRFQIEFKK
ncbi:MAG: IS4 family transposase [Acetobacteraceae bacterium]|nr:IS4 family transposase [Acetobacteraceae bacterium]